MKIQFQSRRTHFTQLCTTLKKHGIECDVINNKKSRNIFSLPTSYYINSIHGDIIVPHNPYHGIYGARIAKKRNQTKHIIFRLKANHWIEQESPNISIRNRLGYKIKKWQNARSFNDIDIILSISDYMKKVAKEQADDKPIYTMYNGVNIKRFKERTQEKEYKTQILCVMNFDVPQKTQLLAKLLTQIKDDKVPYQITLLGDGTHLNKIKDHVRQIKLTTIEFKGHVTNIEKYYSNCDLVIHPSNLESFGMTLLEAGASARPVIATNVGAIPEIIQHNKTGYLTNDIPEFIEYIQKIMETPKIRQQLGQNAKNRIHEEFTWEKSAEKFLEMLEKESLL